jgi:hypothetical protein
MNAATKHGNDGDDRGDKKRRRLDGEKEDPKASATTKPKTRGQKKKDSEAPAPVRAKGKGKKKAAETSNSDGFVAYVHTKPLPKPVFSSFKDFRLDPRLSSNDMISGKSINTCFYPHWYLAHRYRSAGVCNFLSQAIAATNPNTSWLLFILMPARTSKLEN